MELLVLLAFGVVLLVLVFKRSQREGSSSQGSTSGDGTGSFYNADDAGGDGGSDGGGGDSD